MVPRSLCGYQQASVFLIPCLYSKSCHLANFNPNMCGVDFVSLWFHSKHIFFKFGQSHLL